MFRRKNTSSHNQEDEDLHHQAKIKELKDAIGPLSGRNSRFCPDACFRRYMVARNWNVNKAKKMLEETLEWRSSYKPEEIRWPEIAIESETGKAYKANFHDRQGRTVLILRPAMQNTTGKENQIRQLVYLLENAILNLPQGQEQMSWLIDFTGWSMANSVPIRTAHETSYILQNHYPERLAVVKHFLDPKTFEKVKFVYPNKNDSVEVMKSYFDEENLPKEFGGKAILKYNHEEFSKLMIEDDLKAASFWGFDYKDS
ncbi:hypothetical protein K2173_013006 [Erythroxylum novogranatense]|uniref:CRAL-TRIO domain-containing protein n=1 Tax=Erythroxylum novogranatense TaxID=1862640 RepID=A0AAV8S7B1_9ROSI|nr:hypothetical protein K2173_013006 [Erythroxylum novogranatense]